MAEFLRSLLDVLILLAPWLLLGFVVAGLLHAFVPRALLRRALGGHGSGAVVRGALVGMPLPLCSCGVVPVAAELRRGGAGRGPTTAFLVATPETGVDSISASFAVLHPVLAVARPVAAVVTAIAAGLAVERFTPPPAPDGADAGPKSCCGETAAAERPRGLVGGMRYAFVDLFGEVGLYLVPALLLTALLTTLLEPAALAGEVGPPFVQMLLLLLVGIPVYVCATAATPVAAALILAGFTPGAALVFLLVGPATNLLTLRGALAMLGRTGALVYVATVATVSVLIGLGVDLLFTALALDPGSAARVEPHEGGWIGPLSAAVLAALVVGHAVRRVLRHARGQAAVA